ncbi:hypothetical protein AMECASPLE_028886 [Ameca splendens]|uniref:Uncharacterized protein n=1 Tax=Ameca splendens TaxID=208324 RepID=A0ABV1A1X5_9TELE
MKGSDLDLEDSSDSSVDFEVDEDEDVLLWVPVHYASRPMKRKIASVPKNRSCSFKPTKRGKQFSRQAR